MRETEGELKKHCQGVRPWIALLPCLTVAPCLSHPRPPSHIQPIQHFSTNATRYITWTQTHTHTARPIRQLQRTDAYLQPFRTRPNVTASASISCTGQRNTPQAHQHSHSHSHSYRYGYSYSYSYSYTTKYPHTSTTNFDNNTQDMEEEK